MKQLKFIGKIIIEILQAFIDTLGGTVMILLIISIFTHEKVTISNPTSIFIFIAGALLGMNIDYVNQKLN